MLCDPKIYNTVNATASFNTLKRITLNHKNSNQIYTYNTKPHLNANLLIDNETFQNVYADK